MAALPPAAEEEATVKEPLDIIRLSLDERIYVKCRGERELRGKLHVSGLHRTLQAEPTLQIVRNESSLQDGL
jgi:hypothetical protein